MPQKQEILDLDLTPIEQIQRVKGMNLTEVYHFCITFCWMNIMPICPVLH